MDEMMMVELSLPMMMMTLMMPVIPVQILEMRLLQKPKRSLVKMRMWVGTPTLTEIDV
jgi:hypothetical protein